MEDRFGSWNHIGRFGWICESHAQYVQGTSALRACTSNRPSKGAHMAIAIDIPHTPIVSVQKSYNRSMTTENNKNSRFEMRLT